MSGRLRAAFVVAILLFGCENSVLDPTTEATGKVVDHITNQPLEGATVTLSENDDVLLGGARVIAEQKTDAAGNFKFKFEWKESPYKLRVAKENYTYTHIEYNERFENLPPIVSDYQIMESLKKKQDFVFDMEPVGSLVLNITNADANPTDKLTIKFENVNKRVPVVGPQVYAGNSISGYSVGAYAIANKYVRYSYTIEASGTSLTKVDSIFIKHVEPTQLHITY
ncbi:hypothetical protein [uncultured Pontibacter sp.]|uniref:hypothetical protein n=1 Tax=uncultured Pontibacter sp. TaxID=453356 RepID=UPI00261A4FB2|nr:hypothetical protein [uncultured Pontibacter sp.]